MDMALPGSPRAPVIHSDLALLYSRPWMLYKCPGTLPMIQRDHFVNAVESFDDDEPAIPLFGEVSECTVDPIATSTLKGVAVHCLFKSGTLFRLILYNEPAKKVSLLLLSTSGPRRSILDLLDKVLGLSPSEELKLPSSLLSSQLELYLEGLVTHAPTGDVQSFIHDIVGKVDITVTSQAPLAPNLRSLEIGVPASDVWNWLSSSPHHGTFLARLTKCLQTNTGMKLSLGASRGIQVVTTLEYMG